MGAKPSTKAAAAKKESPKKKPSKGSEKVNEKIHEPTDMEMASIDNEDLEEENEEAEAASNSGGGNAAALAAAATGPTELSASFKNFRHHPDMENFYRFIYENDLRLEALAIIDDIMVEKLQRKTAAAKK